MCFEVYSEFGCSEWHEKVRHEPRQRCVGFQKCEGRYVMESQRQEPNVACRGASMLSVTERLKVAVNMERACQGCTKKALQDAKLSREADLARIRTDRQPQELPTLRRLAPKEGTHETAGPGMAGNHQILNIAGGGRNIGSQRERVDAWLGDQSHSEPKIKEESADTSGPAGPSGSAKRRRSRK